MRLIIDMQGAQSSGSRHRGIGRYTLALVKEIVRQSADHEVLLVLNGAFADTIEPIKAEFSDLLPTDAIHVWSPAVPCSAVDPANDQRRIATEIIYEAFLASLRPSAVLVTSLFEGLIDDAVTSIGQFETTVPKAVILYDLIPLIYKDIYLSNPPVSRWYHRKLDHLRRADMLLSISASSGREAVDHLGFPAEQVVNISTACNAEFKPVRVTNARRKTLETTYGLNKPYVMYTGGIDHRKNIEGLIRAFGLLPKAVRDRHQLAIVCAAHEADQQRLEGIARDAGLSDQQLVMTGFVPEDDLLSLYNACTLFVFPSWHEGFGLPALEAMACGRPTIGANTSSLPEVIGLDKAMFDPRDDHAISALMKKGLTDDPFRKMLTRHAAKQARKFSWEQSAQAAWQAVEQMVARREQSATPKQTPQPSARRPKLAYLSPLPGARSGIADYSAELLPELSRHYDIDVIVCQDEPLSDTWVSANAPLRNVEWFRRNYRAFDRVMYHFGNSHFHSHMFDLLRDMPGIVVLHDFFLSGIVAHLDLTGAKPGLWGKTLLTDHGWRAGQERFQASDSADVVWAYPCNGDVFRDALGVIFHSRHGVDLAKTWHGDPATGEWSHLPLLRRAKAFPPDGGKSRLRRQAREALGIGANDFLVCAFGHLARTKLNDRLLDAWLNSELARQPDCQLVFVGQNEGGPFGEGIARRIERAGGRIRITGFVDQADYERWLFAADAATQLRTKSRGETSAAVLDCWNAGLATIVNAHGALAELPDDCVIKLPDEFSDDELIGALERLHRDAKLRETLGQSGRARLLTHHDPRKCADDYVTIIEASYNKTQGGLPGLLERLPALAPQLAPADAVAIAQSISRNFPPKPRRQQWLVDCSALAEMDTSTAQADPRGAFVRHLLLSPPPNVHVEPVVVNSASTGLVTARKLACYLLDIVDDWAEDGEVEAWNGDQLILLDKASDQTAAILLIKAKMQIHGVLAFCISDELIRTRRSNPKQFDNIIRMIN
jgi:glycosyltransferase involved in cell wall biosynthesis